MTTLAILFIAASIAHGLATVLRVPPVPFLIACGILAGTTGLVDRGSTTDDAIILGLSFLVFWAGTELNPARFQGRFRLAATIAISQFVLVIGLSVIGGLLIGFTFTGAFVIGVSLAASSTLVVVRILHRRKLLFEPFGRLVLGVLLVQDTLVLLLLAILTMQEQPTDEALITLGGLFGLVGLTWVCLRWVTPYLLVRRGLDPETLVIVLLAFLFAFSGIAHISGLPLVIGAFFAGVSMSSFPVNGLIRSPLGSLTDFFLALFFVALGASVNLPSSDGLVFTAILVVLVITLTPILVAYIAERADLTARSGIEAGLLLAQTSELSIVVALIGRNQGLLDPALFDVIVLVTVVTMALTPFLARDEVVWRLVHLHPGRRFDTDRVPSIFEGHVLLLGCGQNGMQLLTQLLKSGQSVVAVDDDPIVVAQARALGATCIRGDGADPRVLAAAGAERAGVVVSTMRRVEESLRLIDRCPKGHPILVRVFSETEADRIREAGGTPIVFVKGATETLVDWFLTEVRNTTRA